MPEGAGNGADDAEAELLPEPDGGGVAGNHGVELPHARASGETM